MFVISLRHHAHLFIFFFFFNDTATTEIYTLSLHDALPICGEGADHGEGEGDPGERAPRDRSREVEPDHLGAVAPDDQQTELIAALHAYPRPRRLRSGRSSGLRSFLDQTVNRTLLRPHAGRPTANAVPGGMGTHNQAVGAHGLPFRQPSGQFRVTIMTRCTGP